MIIRLKNLRLRTIIGINTWEREKEQDVIINAEIEFDGEKAGKTDAIEDTLNYKEMRDAIAAEVQGSSYLLLEKLAARLVEVILQDPMAIRAVVEVDKPHALRFCDSVSVVCSGGRKR